MSRRWPISWFLQIPLRIKMTLAWASGILCALALGLALYSHWVFLTYPEHAVTAYTGITKHQTLKKIHSDHDWYVQVSIPADDGERLLTKYPFHTGFNRGMLQGKIDGGHVADCHDCRSYFEGHGHGIYGTYSSFSVPTRRDCRCTNSSAASVYRLPTRPTDCLEPDSIP